MLVGGLVGCGLHCLSPRIHFGQITNNQMLLSIIDELRTNTLSKVRKIRVSDTRTNGIFTNAVQSGLIRSANAQRSELGAA